MGQRCRTKTTKVIDATFFQYFLRFTVGYTFHQFASASFRTFICLAWCDVSSPDRLNAIQHKALLSSTDQPCSSACLQRSHCVDHLGVPGGNMRVRSAIKKLCDSCKVVKRRGKLYIVCKASPKVCVIPSLTFLVARAHANLTVWPAAQAASRFPHRRWRSVCCCRRGNRITAPKACSVSLRCAIT